MAYYKQTRYGLERVESHPIKPEEKKKRVTKKTTTKKARPKQ